MSDDAGAAMATSQDPPTPRSTAAVLGIIAALVAIPMLAVILLLLMRGGTAAGGAADLTEGVRDDRIQAVYMANDAVYFGRLEAGEGDWLRLRDAFFLRASAAAGRRDADDAGAADLVPIEQQAGGDGTLLINAREVALVQNLTSDAEIAERIEDAVG